MTLRFNKRLSITPITENGGGGDTAKGSFDKATQTLTLNNAYVVDLINQMTREEFKQTVLEAVGTQDVIFDLTNVQTMLEKIVCYGNITLQGNPISAILDMSGGDYSVTISEGIMCLNSEGLSALGVTLEQIIQMGGAVDENVFTITGTQGNYDVVFNEQKEYEKKYGADVNNFLGDVDADGVLQEPAYPMDLVFTGVKKIGGKIALSFNRLLQSPEYIQVIKSASFPDLEEVYGNGFSSAFYHTGIENVSFPKLKKIAYKSGIENNYAFSSAFAENFYYDSTERKNKGTLKTVTFPELEIIEANILYCFSGAFSQNPDLTSISFPKLKKVLGWVNTAFNTNYNSGKLTTTEVPALEEIGQRPFQFYQYSPISTANFPSLTKISFQSLFRGFMSCPNLQSVSFPALTSQSFGTYTNQFNQMLQGVTGCTVHFPSNLESVIGSWSDVTSGFGGTNTTVLFDLPATE